MANPFSNDKPLSPGSAGSSGSGRRHSQGPLPSAEEETLTPKQSGYHHRARSSDYVQQLRRQAEEVQVDQSGAGAASASARASSTAGGHYGRNANQGGATGEEAPPSYRIDKDNFVKGNIAIMPTGVVMQGRTKAFSIVPQELKILNNIGRGACGYVQRAEHVPSGTQLALKVINVFDQSKRHQLLREIQALYDADCSSLVKFYGAYFLDGTIQLGLEYMDGGSLANVVKQVGKIPEAALANIAYQVIWGLAYLKHEKRLHRVSI